MESGWNYKHEEDDDFIDELTHAQTGRAMALERMLCGYYSLHAMCGVFAVEG